MNKSLDLKLPDISQPGLNPEKEIRTIFSAEKKKEKDSELCLAVQLQSFEKERKPLN